MTEYSAAELVSAYVQTIYGPVDGLGQHVHPTLGRSDWIMLRLYRLVGEVEANRLLDEAMGVTAE